MRHNEKQIRLTRCYRLCNFATYITASQLLSCNKPAVKMESFQDKMLKDISIFVQSDIWISFKTLNTSSNMAFAA